MKITDTIKSGIVLLTSCLVLSSWAFNPSQQPPDTTAVPGNVVLALSVEFPTGTQASYPTAGYTYTVRYEGYFDNRKCYTYSTTNEVFTPASAQNIAAGTCPAADQWSGNLLNWLTMTNLDQFRSVLTGGTRDDFSSMTTAHPGDNTTRTVLIRTYGSQQGSAGNNPNRNLTVGTPGMPLTGVNKLARSFGYGSKFIVSNANNFANLTLTEQKATCAATPLPGTAGTSWCFNIRVEACVAVPGVGLEANCQNKYSGVAKPEGLIQEYNVNMRFAALGYLNVANGTRDGAVLRSAMKSVGPVAATTNGVVANPAPEWNSTTGVLISNPDPADATASNVTNSGLINYLNKFGYSGIYETYDNVSELYYAAQLYLRGRAPPTNYSNNLTAALKDDFPVITGNNLLRQGTRDPMINTCQKNFILGIGDINTHCDGNLPGSNNTRCSAGTPTDQDGVNVQNLWSTIAGMEGLALNGAVGVGGGVGLNSGNTPYIASLAFWGNTNDIRGDLVGTQNIRTYWVDVLEAWGGTLAAASLRKTQYWMATKYGGFKTEEVSGNNPNTNALSWDNDGNGSPDNWFAGSSPNLLRNGLSTAFADIASISAGGSASSAAVTSSRQTSSSQIIYAGYDPRDWSGTVSACSPVQTATQCANSPIWEASRWFKTSAPTLVATPLTPTTRKIITSWKAGTFTRMPFRWSELNADQRSLLDLADSQGSARLDYLRGDRVNETSNFRPRGPNLLGDIVNSGVTYVAGSGPALIGAKFPGHVAYRISTRNRPPVVYVGGNDGMLHAFSGTDGKELFGYVPSSVFGNLPALTALNFQHRFFVDSTPMVGDIQKTADTWGTLLVGGLGAGGKGYYALDISGQGTFETSGESTLATTLPIWEFTDSVDPDLGYTFNEPSINPLTGAYQQIAKVADAAEVNGLWRVIVGNGYGSVGPATTPATPGRAVLFMLDANTGTVGTKLVADGGPTNGLSAPTPVDTDRDGLVDTVYAGDARGNMHKFQFSKPSGLDFVRAPSGDVAGEWRYLGRVYATGEPITTAPSVAQACNGVGWSVAFGTGKLNENADYGDNAMRGFYMVTDRAPSSTLTVPAADLATITYTGTTTRTWTTPVLTNRLGWKMSFTEGERVLSNSTLPPDTGSVLFATTKPAGDICTPGNTGFVMAVNRCSGKIGDLIVNGNIVGGAAINSTGVIKVSNTYSDSNNKQTVVCNQNDCKAGGIGSGGGGTIPSGTACDNPATVGIVEQCNCDDPSTAGVVEVCSSINLGPAVTPRGRYSWREILTK